MSAAKRVADDVIHLLLTTSADTACALDAGVEIDGHRRMRKVSARLPPPREPRLADTKPSSPLREFGIGLVDALRHIGDQHFDDQLLRMNGTRGGARHLHPRRRSPTARWRQHSLAFDLDHARAAIAVGAHTGRVTQMRNLDPVTLRRFDDRFASARGDRRAVQLELDFAHESSLGK